MNTLDELFIAAYVFIILSSLNLKYAAYFHSKVFSNLLLWIKFCELCKNEKIWVISNLDVLKKELKTTWIK